MVIHNPILTGSFTVNNIDVSSITSSAANITALNATTASLNSFSASVLSYTASQNILNGTYTLTSSFAAQTASFTAFSASINAFSASILAQTASLNSFSASVLTFTGSAATRLGALEAATASLYTATSSLNTSVASLNSYTQSTDAKIASIYSTTSSLNTRVGTLEAYTSSLNDKTSSFATTGSNNFIGTQTITGSVLQSGSFTSTGTLTAQTLVVQTITSSVVYSSGSNIFGNTIGNTQTFTGSVLVTGSLTIAGGSSATSYSGATIYGSTAVCSPVGKFTSCIDVGSGNFSSNVCVGGGLVAQQASTFGNTVAVFGSTAQLYIGATAGVSDYTILKWCTTDKSLNIHNQSTNGSPQLVIACNGNVGIKTIATPSYDLEVRGNIGIISSTSAGLITISNLCAAGTITGLVRFDGLHTPSLTTYTGPSISACKDDANYTTSLAFKTTDGSGINNANLRITGAGVACFASTVCAPLFVGGVINGSGFCTSGGIVGNNSNNLYLSSNSAAGEISFWGNQLNTRLMTITGCGNVGIGFTGYGGSKLTLVASTNPTCASSANMQLSIGEASQNTTYSFKLGYIYVGGGYVGAIQTIAGGSASTTVINPDGGNVGIGTSSPSSLLHIYSSASSNTTQKLEHSSTFGAFQIINNASSTLYVGVNNSAGSLFGGTGGAYGGAISMDSAYALGFATSGSERMRITSGGSVGINTNSPTSNTGLTAKRPTGTGWIIDALNGSNVRMGGIYSTGGNNGQLYLGNSAGTETILLDSAGTSFFNGGNVGIGTSVPDSKLHICNAVAGGTNNYLIIVQNCCTVADSRAGIAFSNNSQTPSAGGLSGASIQTSNNGVDGAGNLLFSTLISGTNCERMRITSGGNVGINNSTPNGLFEAGMTCAKTTYGGLLFNTVSVVDSNWFCFFYPPGNWAGLMTMNWVATNDFNRSGAAQIRWSYQDCAATIGPRTSIFNDSQNATATFRYAGGWLQACIGGAGAGYNVQFTIMGARGG